MDFVEVVGGKKATVAQERLVHRAELVDGQQLVADAATAPPTALATGERHQPDDGLPQVVGKAQLAQQRQGAVVEQTAVQRRKRKGFARTGDSAAASAAKLALAGAAEAGAFGHQLEEPAQGGVEVDAFAGLRRVERLQFEVAQAFQAVALEVDVAFGDGHVAEFRARLDVEQKEQAVDQAQTFQAEVAGVELVLAAEKAFLGVGGLLAQLAGGFVAQHLDGFAQCVLEVFANAEGVFVGVFVQAFQQAPARARGEAVLVQQRGRGLEGVGVLAVENIRPIETQRPVVGPLVAVEQQPFVQPAEQHIARRRIGSKDHVREQVRPGFVAQARRYRLPGVVQVEEPVVQQIFVFRAGLVGGEDGELRQLPMPERQGLAGGQFVQLGLRVRRGIPKGQEQAALKLSEQAPALGRLAGALHLAAQGKPLLGKGLQLPVGRTARFARGRVFGNGGRESGLGGVPGIEPSLDVALEHFGEVVVAVELVFIGDAGEGLHGVERAGHGGHGQAPVSGAVGLGWQTAASTWIQGCGSVVRVSATQRR